MYNGPFKWWVQSVMPLVFDDSLSYYEVLAKLTKYIEGLTGDVEQIEKILATIEGIGDVTEFTKFLETIQAEIGNLEDLQTPSKTNLVSAINEVALKANIAYWKPPTGIPESDLSQEVQDKLNNGGSSSTDSYIINNVPLKKAPNNNSPSDLGLGTYSVPDGGIPWDTLSKDVQDRIDAGGGGTGGTKDYTELINKPAINGHTLNAGNNSSESLGLGTYSKPADGIPESDLSAEVQEKLNTSGGIADSEISFVATRDYEAGELIYINGVLYKTKYKILSGTNLVPGNNIEETDISSEIERINSDIEALQSGSGPDSWALSANVEMLQANVDYRFFEYINAIGGESYTIIFTPIIPKDVNNTYVVEARKRDGTLDTSFGTIANFNQVRKTWEPNDTGEYYFVARTAYSNLQAKVEIEYTASQGISELWSQVNQASQLEPRVEALETIVDQHTEQLETLEDIPETVASLKLDVENLKENNCSSLIASKVISSGATVNGITYTNTENGIHCEGLATGTSYANIINSINEYPADFVAGKEYIVSFESTGNMMVPALRINYGDNQSTQYLSDGETFIAPDAVGFNVRIQCASGSSVNEYVKFFIMDSYSNQKLTEIVNDNAEDIEKISSIIGNLGDNIFNEYDVLSGVYINPTTRKIAATTANDSVICFPIEPNTGYIVKKDTATTMRIGCGASSNPSVGYYLDTLEYHTSPSADAIKIYAKENDNYMYIQTWTATDPANLRNIDANVASLKVFIDIDSTLNNISNKQAENSKDINKLNNTKIRNIVANKVSIIGDSISTFNEDGYHIDGYRMYYPSADVLSVDDTWWKKVLDSCGATIEINASFSGSRVTDTREIDGYPDLYDRVGLIGEPDTIIIALGHNDQAGHVTVGDYDYETDYALLSESEFRPAYIKGVKALQSLYPNAKIICVMINVAGDYKESIENIANELGCIVIDANDYEYAQTIHPGKKGMKQIASAVLYPTDMTLKQMYVPADGKTTGDKIEALRQEIMTILINNNLNVD